MVQQLSVFLQNKSGKIAAVVRALSESGVDIRALSIADTADFGILRMLVSDISAAKAALAEHNCILSVNEVTVIAVPDTPGGLSRVLSLMAQEEIDIEYMYSLIERGVDVAYMVFRVSDEARLLEVLSENAIETVTPQKLGLK
ncbi:MAG: amino acid-binding protein [Firmicutes bacterium]|nr:amino acid-binding protein [Bacillota bacterium]